MGGVLSFIDFHPPIPMVRIWDIHILLLDITSKFAGIPSGILKTSFLLPYIRFSSLGSLHFEWVPSTVQYRTVRGMNPRIPGIRQSDDWMSTCSPAVKDTERMRSSEKICTKIFSYVHPEMYKHTYRIETKNSLLPRLLLLLHSRFTIVNDSDSPSLPVVMDGLTVDGWRDAGPPVGGGDPGGIDDVGFVGAGGGAQRYQVEWWWVMQNQS